MRQLFVKLLGPDGIEVRGGKTGDTFKIKELKVNSNYSVNGRKFWSAYIYLSEYPEQTICVLSHGCAYIGSLYRQGVRWALVDQHNREVILHERSHITFS